MARRYVGDFKSDQQFDTDINWGRKSIPFGDELRRAVRDRSKVIGGMLVVPGIEQLAEEMDLTPEEVLEAGQRIGAEGELDILSHATGYPVVEVSGYAIELEGGPVIESKPNVDVSDIPSQSDLIERIVAHNDPQDVARFLGALGTALAQRLETPSPSN